MVEKDHTAVVRAEIDRVRSRLAGLTLQQLQAPSPHPQHAWNQETESVNDQPSRAQCAYLAACQLVEVAAAANGNLGYRLPSRQELADAGVAWADVLAVVGHDVLHSAHQPEILAPKRQRLLHQAQMILGDVRRALW